MIIIENAIIIIADYTNMINVDYANFKTCNYTNMIMV